MSHLRRLLYTLCLLTLTGTLLLAQQPKKSAAVRKLERQRTELLNAIKKTDKEIKSLGQSLSEKAKQDKLVRQQIKDRSQVIVLLDQEVALLNISIDSLAIQIGKLQQKEEVSRERYAKTLQALQQRPRFEDRLLFILSASSFDEGIRRVRYLSAYARAHKEVAAQLHTTREQLQASQNQLIATKQQKGTLLQLRAEERVKLEQQQKSIASEVKELSTERQSLQKKLKQQQRKAEQLNQAIQDQIAREIAEAERKAREERERLEREARKKGKKVPKEAERRAETKDGYAMDAAERKLASSFAANKGQLPPPVKGRYRVIRRFGLQQHDDLAMVQTRNGGIDIQVARGTEAVAIFDGVVSKVFVVPGYHNSIIIRHGNYLTVYANLQNVSVRAGQKVKTGQVLGTVASDDGGQYGVMQFQVWHERNKLNPQAWIR
ncbi:murein hydrolase activator EnvC family protein [Porphyromonas asaccharolytica]|uniref:murein hydrolase activator EnvC family protein n=1 Tax=Porphyromonas asaccharolytica TaxID=28123 RepID=UPI0001EB1561|nr:peptidoglycan DD-metalloendopeptidase family protein [Porphyromonas asaccharolytica]EFR35431.1 peptidase, M23 family [Porphyromonas asaccharolytica PR426713P-I]